MHPAMQRQISGGDCGLVYAAGRGAGRPGAGGEQDRCNK
jgi:hypothetical protein